jgi:carboxyl-terminal processing protease
MGCFYRRWKRFVGSVVFLWLCFSVASAGTLTCSNIPDVIFDISSKHLYGGNSHEGNNNAVFEKYIHNLDSQKLYLLQADVEKLRNKYEKDLLEKLHADHTQSSCDSIYAINALFKSRYKQAHAYMRGFVSDDFAFDLDDFYEANRKTIERPANLDEAKQRWKKNVKLSMYHYVKEGKDEKEALDLVFQDLSYFYKYTLEDLNDDSKVLSILLRSYANTLDPHSVYMLNEQYDALVQAFRLKLIGVGARLTIKQGVTTIVDLLEGGPAKASAQVFADDKIIGVGQGLNGKVESVVGMRLNSVVKLIKGKKGTHVRLKLERMRDELSEQVEVSLIRSEVKRIEDRVSLKTKTLPDGVKVLVVDIPSFYEGVSSDLFEHLKTNKYQRDYDSIVIDLRNNGGGLLNESVSLSSIFLGDVPVVQTKSKNQVLGVKELFDLFLARQVNVRVMSDNFFNKPYALAPLVILVSNQSASASEIFAAAMQDYKRGVIVGGEKTFGKGSVQEITQLSPPGLGAVKVTMAEFYRVTGKSTQLLGVNSDLVMPKSGFLSESFENDFSNAINNNVIDPVNKHSVKHSFPVVSLSDKKYLVKRSKSRIAENSYFNKLAESSVLKRKAGVSLTSLNLNLKNHKETKVTLEDKIKNYSENVLEETVLIASDLHKLTMHENKQVGLLEP